MQLIAITEWFCRNLRQLIKQLVDWEIESNNHPKGKYNSIAEVDVNHIYKETDN